MSLLLLYALPTLLLMCVLIFTCDVNLMCAWFLKTFPNFDSFCLVKSSCHWLVKLFRLLEIFWPLKSFQILQSFLLLLQYIELLQCLLLLFFPRFLTFLMPFPVFLILLPLPLLLSFLFLFSHLLLSSRVRISHSHQIIRHHTHNLITGCDGCDSSSN
ncbi:hypothetical protein PMIN01_05985 [Paraphaeosphaeria minitans]|uniref:Uncharacterized protein n=1 Tax=Paraphaeosphaeria minitans TaxID=565426 RepID=A0A9P6GKJ9_9PLEO|nr:hypothetical protein PMIN01_05985 [Paraphaeosphaeria minitans]